MQQMTCPKCQGAMRQYERSGVVVDQCSECRGIFLDRGELEKLVDAENSFYGQSSQAPPPAQPQPPQPPQYQQPPQHQQQYAQQHHQQPRYEERRYDSDGYGRDYHYKKKKKHSFFEELFD
ncbi:MAG: zf-TFIIB domain-containing protein [Hamadaea sp.]|uniref:TFIIB-type zinc ribbon-containing protein n=1 Tax=Hamadaea sp. TaxID=2024425 RepID=UPI0017EBC331|nr:zf-TFIIB domain-containing protein [Hamadaea sp.]NUR73161.1 zf-TFIIB domain-containing protein [Hamadaea sp.]NUT18473.1 zf-TFIIB domain-containing protein [Hamadaea sp.]